VIQAANFTAPTPPTPPRSDAPRADTARADAAHASAPQDAAAPAGSAEACAAANGARPSRAGGPTNRASTACPSERPAPTERGGEDFAALLLPMAEAPAMPVATTAASAAAPATTPEAPAATPDQWLAMLAGALAQPVAVNRPDATPVAPAGIPSSAPTLREGLPPVLPPVLGAAMPMATTGTAAPLPAELPGLDAALGALLPTAEATSEGGGDAKPAFDTMLGGLAAPVAQSPLHAVREAAPAPPPLQMPSDSAAGFDDGIGTHVAWMAGQRLGEARIQVSPEHLGPIEVTLKLDDARVDAHFHSTHVEVRAALEASVPRLREMLAQHGLQLGQADVGQRQYAGGQPQAAPTSQFGGDSDAGDVQATSTPVVVQRRGLLDEYA